MLCVIFLDSYIQVRLQLRFFARILPWLYTVLYRDAHWLRGQFADFRGKYAEFLKVCSRLTKANISSVI